MTGPARPTGPIEAVTFDFWNTLVRQDDGIRAVRLDACQKVLSDAGMEVDRADLERAFERAWDAYVERWHANQVFTAADAVPVMVSALGADAGVVTDLVEVFLDPPGGWRPPLTENVTDCLGELRDAGVAIGIICDVGLTPSTALRGYLADHGVLDQFDHWSFSDEVGVYKPDSRIFDHALHGLSAAVGRTIDPSRMAHVGDLRRTDIAGALSFGATAVRYAGAFDDPGETARGTDTIEGHLVVTDHAFLPAALGVVGSRPVPT